MAIDPVRPLLGIIIQRPLWVKSGHCAVSKPMSGLPPKADIAESDWDVRFVPKADIAPALLLSAGV